MGRCVWSNGDSLDWGKWFASFLAYNSRCWLTWCEKGSSSALDAPANSQPLDYQNFCSASLWPVMVIRYLAVLGLTVKEALKLWNHGPLARGHPGFILIPAPLPPRLNGWLWGGRHCQSATSQENLSGSDLYKWCWGEGKRPSHWQVKQAVDLAGLVTYGSWIGSSSYLSCLRPSGHQPGVSLVG